MEEEIQDIVNDKDEVIGTDTRDNIWKRGLQHNVRTVNIFLLNPSRKLLVPKRSRTKKMWPGCFDFSLGENVIAGESYDHAAVRGLREELGISVVDIKKLGKLTPKDGIACFATVFEGLISDQKIELNKEEIDEIFWMDIKEIKILLKSYPEKFKRDFKEIFERYYS